MSTTGKLPRHLEQARLPFTVEFQYLEQGIRVRGEWFPVLKMGWVEGLTLNEFVEEHLQRPQNLKMLLDLWVKLTGRLRETGMAHADLQHGNVLLVPMGGGALGLRLIDYDGMYVPSLAEMNSHEVGHAAYQHPQRLREGIYNAEVDRFSHLVIYGGIRCLIGGQSELWQRFNNGDNLLFRQSDFSHPANSEVFHALWQHKDADARALVGRLILACCQPLADVPWLDEVVSDGQVRPLTQAEEGAVEESLAAREEPVKFEDSEGLVERVVEEVLASRKAPKGVGRSGNAPAAMGAWASRAAWLDQLPGPKTPSSEVGRPGGLAGAHLDDFADVPSLIGELRSPSGSLGGTGVSPVPRSRGEPASAPLKLKPIAAQSIEVGKLLNVATAIENADVWKGRVKHSLGPVGPPEATIDAQTGVFHWTPSEDQPPGTYDVIVSVRGPDGRSDQQRFQVTVTRRLKKAVVDLGGGVSLEMILIPAGGVYDGLARFG